jgi:hypothetical protein
MTHAKHYAKEGCWLQRMRRHLKRFWEGHGFSRAAKR